MAKYEHKTYGTGFVLKVEPEDRAADVSHYLITGHLLGGRSLYGVVWEKVNDSKYATKELSKSMRETATNG